MSQMEAGTNNKPNNVMVESSDDEPIAITQDLDDDMGLIGITNNNPEADDTPGGAPDTSTEPIQTSQFVPTETTETTTATGENNTSPTTKTSMEDHVGEQFEFQPSFPI